MASTHVIHRYLCAGSVFSHIMESSGVSVQSWLRGASKESTWPDDNWLHTELMRLPPAAARSIIELRTGRALPLGKQTRNVWMNLVFRRSGACGCGNAECIGDIESWLASCEFVTEERIELYDLMALLQGR